MIASWFSRLQVDSDVLGARPDDLNPNRPTREGNYVPVRVNLLPNQLGTALSAVARHQGFHPEQILQATHGEPLLYH